MADRIFNVLANLIERLLALAFVFAVALNFVNVLARYLFDAPILAADEIQIYIMIWITFLGAVVVTWRRQHLRMDVLVQAFPPRLQQVLRLLELALMGLLAGFMLWHSWDYTARMFMIGRASDTAGIPLWLVHAALAVGFGLIALICLFRLAFTRDSAASGATAGREKE
jgi:TRAP-type transport system small permease protein